MKRINIIGDSHTAALGPLLQDLLREHDVQFNSYPGYSTERILEALQSGISRETERAADLTIVIAGGNDFGSRGKERAALVQYLVQNHGGRILWVGPAHSKRADVDARHSAQAGDQAEQMPFLEVAWLDSYPATQSGHGPDGVHFTDFGYRAWAADIAVEARKQLRSNMLWVAIGWLTLVGVSGAILYKTLHLGRR